MINDIEFIKQSLINNMYYLRKIRDYCVNLQLAFFEKDQYYIRNAEALGIRCAEIGNLLISIADDYISEEILESNFLFTQYTLPCELLTEKLFGVELNTEITEEQVKFKSGNSNTTSKEIVNKIEEINIKCIAIVDDFIEFCKDIHSKQKRNELFAYSPPFLIMHLIVIADLYKNFLERLMKRLNADPTEVVDYEYLYNTSMKNIAIFIRSFVNASSNDVFIRAQSFVVEFDNLLTEYKRTGLTPENQKILTNKSITIVTRFQNFVKTLVEGLLNAELYFIIEPLALDNFYKSANYFKYILTTIKKIEN